MDIKQRAMKVQRNVPKYIGVVIAIVVLLTQSSVAERSTPTRYVIDQTSSVTSIEDGAIQMGKPANTPSSIRSSTSSDNQAECKMALDKETGLQVIATRVIEVKYKEGVLIDHQLGAIESTYGLTKHSHFPRLRIIFLQTSSFSQIQSVMEALSNDHRFESVRLQVIEHINTPR